MLSNDQLLLVLNEKTLAPLERMLICRFVLDGELLTASYPRIANQLGLSEAHISKAMARLISMKCFKRNATTGHLVMNDFDNFRLHSRDLKT